MPFHSIPFVAGLCGVSEWVADSEEWKYHGHATQLGKTTDLSLLKEMEKSGATLLPMPLRGHDNSRTSTDEHGGKFIAAKTEYYIGG